MVVYVLTCVLVSIFYLRPRFQSVAEMVNLNRTMCVVRRHTTENTVLIADTQYFLLLPPTRQKHDNELNFC